MIPAKTEWELKYEPRPSLCRHWWPANGAHRMSNSCWCEPRIQNEKEYTVVHHQDVFPGVRHQDVFRP